MWEFVSTVFIWVGFLTLYIGAVLLIARFCGLNSRYDRED